VVSITPAAIFPMKTVLSLKPGWVRLSLHPTMSDEELLFIIDAIGQISENADK